MAAAEAPLALPDIHAIVQNFLEQVRGTWRFRWLALIIAWCVAIVLWIGVFMIPDTFQANARVFVDTRTTLGAATRGIAIEADVDTQIEAVRQALLGEPALLKVAQETGLVSASAAASVQQLQIAKLRDAIQISGGISRDSPGAGVVTISYSNHSRTQSLQVVQRLLDSFVRDTLGGKRQGSKEAQQFLIAQIADYDRQLSAAEERLAAFKRRNVGLMPGAQGDYFTRLQAEMDGLSKAEETLNVTVRRRDELQRQLRGEGPFLSGSAAPTPGSPAISDTATQIRETRQRLDQLLLRFTDKYPDVIALKRTLEELQNRQKLELEAVRRGDPGAADRVGLTANPVYQNIELQYNQAQVDAATIEQDIRDREHKIANLRSLINTAPEVEAEFAKLNRDYDVTRAQYHALLERLEQARLGEQAAATGIVRFEVVDPPSARFTPVAPKRPQLIAAAFVVALAAGTAVAYLMNLLRPVFLSTRQLWVVTGLPVIGAVNMTWLEKRRLRRRLAAAVYAGSAIALAVAGICVLALQARIAEIIRGVV